MRNPKWTRDELLLTLDFYHKNFPKRNSDSISSLSKITRKIQTSLDIDSKYRNENGVYMK